MVPHYDKLLLVLENEDNTSQQPIHYVVFPHMYYLKPKLKPTNNPTSFVGDEIKLMSESTWKLRWVLSET